MVYCELVEPNSDDYGKKIVRVPPKLLITLHIQEGEIIEVISKNRRVGVIAKKDLNLANYNSITPEEQALLNDKGTEVIALRPEGVDYTGDVVLSSENLQYIRLDGELRNSLQLSIGDIVEVDTTLKPPFAQSLFINLFHTSPESLTFEEKQILLQTLKRNLLNLPISAGLITTLSLGFKEETILLQATIPNGIVIINDQTNIELQDLVVNLKAGVGSGRTSYDDIGGLHQAIQFFRRLVEIPIKKPEIFNNINIRPPKGILISGPSGCGKSLLIEALANETGLSLTRLPANLFSGIGVTEQNFRYFIDDLIVESKYKKILLLMDNLDTLTPSPYMNQPEFEKRFTIQFALGIEKLNVHDIIILGTCTSIEKVHPMMRRIGRFDIEYELSMPNKEERFEILKIKFRSIPLAKDITPAVIELYSERMMGFSGADIALFVKEAGLHAISRNSNIFLNYKHIPPSLMIGIKITQEDFEKAFTLVEPSGLKSIQSIGEKPKISWNDIGGLKSVKQILKEHVEWQFKHPEVYKRMGIDFPRGLLLYGPPGNGKTLLAKAIASQIQANFLSIKGPELLSMWFGDSARMIRELFQRAQKLSPAIIFFDEIDAVVPRRGVESSDVGREVDATVNQLLTLLDGMDKLHSVFIIGATNRPGAIDPALMRPGRLDRLVHVPMPDKHGRFEILKIHTDKIPIINKNQLISEFAERTENYSGADLENLCREAVIASLRKDFYSREVNRDHFEEAINLVAPSVDEKLVNYYQTFSTRLKTQIEFSKSTRHHDFA